MLLAGVNNLTDAQSLASDSVSTDDKITQVMAYLQNSLAWGEVITKKAIRISTWLRTPMAPQYVCLHNAQVVTLGSGTATRPQPLKQIHIPASQITGFHIMPPEHDPMDYDEKEPNRVLVQVAALVGPFRFDGSIRISVHTDLEHFLDMSKETFTTMYDVEISQLSQPSKGIVQVPMAIVRREVAVIAI